MLGKLGVRQPADQVGSASDAIASVDTHDLGSVYSQYARRVGDWAARLGGPGLDPEDLIHDVFLIVRRELPHFRGEAKLSTWLYRITINVVRDRRRREKRRWLRELLFGREEPKIDYQTPFESREQRELLRAVYATLDLLSERDRTLLVLFEIEGLPGEQVAEILDLKIDTLWVLLHRARKRFRTLVEREHPALASHYGGQK